MHAAGLRVIANVKPCLLTGHPLLDEARAEGLLISSPTASRRGRPGTLGAIFDFTAGHGGVVARAGDALLDVGIDATWNDNNEFEITSPSALADVGLAIDAKPLQTMLMLRASRDAQRARAPGVRPFLVSLGGAGLQRYAQTWTGDNATSRWGDPALEHPHGPGAQPLGRLQPRPRHRRFSRRPGRTPNSSSAGSRPESWHAALRSTPGTRTGRSTRHGCTRTPPPLVRDLIRLREQLHPPISMISPGGITATASRSSGRPSSTFPDDPAAFQDCDELMLGPALLRLLRRRAGRDERRVRPPAGARWRDFWTGEAHAGGRPVVLPARSAGRRSWCAEATRRSSPNIAAQSSTRARTRAPSPHLRRLPNSSSKRSAVRTTA